MGVKPVGRLSLRASGGPSTVAASLSMTAVHSIIHAGSCRRPRVRTLRRHEQVDALQDVEEKLVAPILDALATPADLARHLAGDLRLLLFCLRHSRKRTAPIKMLKERLKRDRKRTKGEGGRYLVLVSESPGRRKQNIRKNKKKKRFRT